MFTACSSRKPLCQRSIQSERQLSDLFQKSLDNCILDWALFIRTSAERALLGAWCRSSDQTSPFRQVQESYLGQQVQTITCCYIHTVLSEPEYFLPTIMFRGTDRNSLRHNAKELWGKHRHWQLEEYMAVLPSGIEELNCWKNALAGTLMSL